MEKGRLVTKESIQSNPTTWTFYFKGLRFTAFFILMLVAASVLIVTDIGADFRFNNVKYNFLDVATFEKPRVGRHDPGFFVKTVGCHMPAMEPFSKSIRRFVYKEKEIHCNKTHFPASVVESNSTSLWIVSHAKSLYNVTADDNFTCCFREFFRPPAEELEDNQSRNYDDQREYSPSCIPFATSVNIDKEFIKVTCRVNDTLIYTDFHSFVPIKSEVEKRCDAISSSASESERVSVLIIGIDAVSRLNFHRNMPKTLQFLLRNLSAVEMIGYNKVNDNTFPNIVPVLTGLSVEELNSTCWPTSDTFFDKCPFIWKNYSAEGYRTVFAEDSSWMSIFNYIKQGFRSQPTDYYWRTFNLLMESEIGHERRLNANLCVGNRLTYQTLLSYTDRFVRSMQNRSYFGLFWEVSLTHDFVNYPGLADEQYEQFFKELSANNKLNDTVVVVMSDHGIRWGQLRSTYQGMMEERQPFLYVALPSWMSKKYPAASVNLQRNARMLTSPFDLHETLSDLLDLRNLDSEVIRNRTSEVNRLNPRGVSLFLPIPSIRTCATAGITPHWCTCHESSPQDVTSEAVKNVTNYIVRNINTMLSEFPQCFTLALNRIIDANMGHSAKHLNTEEALTSDYTVTFETIPGLAQFQATVRFKPPNYNLTGSISRINLYGNQSRCVDNFHMKLYCYC